MDRKDSALIGLGFIVASLVVAVVATTFMLRVRSTGRIKTVNIEAYSDADCTVPVTEINWGILAPGEVAQAQIYLRNGGNVPVIVSLNTTDWLPPEAETFLQLTWDLLNSTFSPSEIKLVNLVLTVSPSIQGITDFAFTIVITGTG